MKGDLKTVLFTFDYELFLGARSGKAKDCIIDPTRRLLDLFKRYDFTAVFFVDTTYLMRLQEIAGTYKEAAKDLADINEQLILAARQGHAIFPHIHSHWLDAKYLPVENEWTLENTRYYQFSSVPQEQQQYLFDRSMQIIDSLASLAAVNHKTDAYRAGGWSIQPFSHFRPYFVKYGIVHEWSVMPGKYHFSDAHTFDFRDAPIKEPVYQFNEDPCLEDRGGPFTEWTISTLSMTHWERWINFKIGGLLRRLGKMPFPKGNTVSSVIKEEGDIYSKKDRTRVIASFEGLNLFTLKKYLYIIRRSAYFQFISHPKLITSFEFAIVERLFRSLKRNCEIQTDFRKVPSK
jgi:peptidoglycan/xylan/chitin deacetylase (PgdA/CDA1 family)